MSDYLKKAASLVFGDGGESTHQSAPETLQQPAGNAAAAQQASAREVQGSGGYVYRQHPDGRIEIVSGKGAGTEVEVGSAAHEAITAEIGAFPQAAAVESPMLDAAAAGSDQAEAAGGWWADPLGTAYQTAQGAKAAAENTAYAGLNAATERAGAAAGAFMEWMGGQGHSDPSQVQVPVAEAAQAKEPTAEELGYTDNLEQAETWLDKSTRYLWGANETHWASGGFDCSSFTAYTMGMAGYDVNATAKYVPAGDQELTPEEADAAAIDATIFDFTHMTEAALPELREVRMANGDAKVEELCEKWGINSPPGLQQRIDKIPDAQDKALAQAHRDKAKAAKVVALRALVEARDPRIRGGVNAMEVGGIGTEVELEDIKPGDIVQTWDLYSSGALFGHSTQAYAVECVADVVVDGELQLQQQIRIDGNTDPATIDRVHSVKNVELIGAHMAGKNNKGESVAGGVYVKAPTAITPAEGTKYEQVYAGRLSGSDWASWEEGHISEAASREAAAQAAAEAEAAAAEQSSGILGGLTNLFNG